ncbi:hypothetical protein ACFQZZ_33165 [Nocardia sp. GCM10030253]|uniref:hypothetical protein n=1 Tax=Nocardia sp. GCM10030253 TaxID=3273404 RepID=UPI0036287C42
MKPEITPAHREALDHLLEEGSETLGVIPSALAGHYPPGSDQADMSIDWGSPFPVFAHPADPDRLLIGVFTDHGWTLVALDHIAHLFCEHPVCGAVIDQRLRELTEIPSDASLFATQDVQTSWCDAPLPYVVHIDDHQAAAAKGWNGTLTDHTEITCWWA